MALKEKQLLELPKDPGVYLMRDGAGKVLYVGKAKSLKTRVLQYVRGQDKRPQIPYLLAEAEEVETWVLGSELEALLLENNLIKKHQPKYNVLLKDDKSFIGLFIASKDPWPRIELKRFKGKLPSNGLFFGPYVSAQAAKAALEMIQRLFPLRRCSDEEFARRKRPCMLYHIKRCVAPCVGKCSDKEYQSHVDQAVSFLKGQTKEVIAALKQQRDQASDELSFEHAQHLHETLSKIESLHEKQHVDRPEFGERDIFALVQEKGRACVAQTQYVEGKLLGVKTFPIEVGAQEDPLESFLLQYAISQKDLGVFLPKLILLGNEPKDLKTLEAALSKINERKVTLECPKQGDKLKQVKIALQNAKLALLKSQSQKQEKQELLFELEKTLKLKQYPHRIACIDNSHLAGQDPVSAIVMFEEGYPCKQAYRHYRLDQGLQDDYEAMRQTLERAFSRFEKEGSWPQLFVVDGGKGQLSVALKVLAAHNFVGMDVVALCKEEARHDKGLSGEKVYLPGESRPLFLPRKSKLLFFLQSLRDEAHRFCLTAQKNRRSKRLVSSALDKVAGIGPVKKKRLLQHFGSWEKIRGAEVRELLEVKGISKKDVEQIKKAKLCDDGER